MHLETLTEHHPFAWQLAARTGSMNPSVLREILKLTEQPGIISFAGGLPAPSTFPVDEVRAACDRILARDGPAALQYAASEGFKPLREYVADSLPWDVDPATVLITTGSQQGFDLLAKVMVDPGSRLLVESPTYLGALQAFTVLGADIVAVNGHGDGLDLVDLRRKQQDARALYIQPNFQNPTGRTMPHEQRLALGAQLEVLGVPFIEDDPYGQLWFDKPPPPPLAASFPDHGVYLGSLSKVLAPGLRLGYLVAPPSIFPKLLQAKQAADLHSSTFDQRIAHEVIKDGFLQRHVPDIRAQYQKKRDLMLCEMEIHMAGLGVQWNIPAGGMFIWVRLPPEMSAEKLLSESVKRGVAFVPGAPFYSGLADARSLRLSFVNATSEQISVGIQKLAQAIAQSSAAVSNRLA